MTQVFKLALNGEDIDLSQPVDISIHLRFNEAQPNAYGADVASSKPCEAGELIGDSRLGGSCNFEQYVCIPHCNGTHTECVGHITHERISVTDCLKDVFIPAVLISVEPEVSESGNPLITHQILEKAMASEISAGRSALIVRTLPNDQSKLSRRYDENNIPPYFTAEAIEYVVAFGFRHLLVDMPSIDRMYDDGKLTNHRMFWNVEPGSFATNAETRMNSTITEMVYVPNEVADGNYLLNLQIAPFAADASPSRPILFKII